MESAKAGNSVEQTIIERVASRKTALTLREFAELYSIAYKTAFQWATQGRIPAIQIGSSWRIDPASLAAWLREQEITSNARCTRSHANSHRQLETGSVVPTPSLNGQSTSSLSADPSHLAASV
jgi:excisionase family DNA binding protein